MHVPDKFRSKHPANHYWLPGVDQVVAVLDRYNSVKYFTGGKVIQTGKRQVAEVVLGIEPRHKRALVLEYFATSGAKNQFYVMPRYQHDDDQAERLQAVYEELAELLHDHCESIGISFRPYGPGELVSDELHDAVGEESAAIDCGHAALIAALLHSIRHTETTAEILELGDLLRHVAAGDSTKADSSFHALKVHLDQCDFASEELRNAERELEARATRIRQLEARPIGDGLLVAAIAYFADMKASIGDQGALVARARTAHESQVALVASLQAEHEVAQEACKPHLATIAEAAQSGNLEALQEAYLVFGPTNDEAKRCAASLATAQTIATRLSDDLAASVARYGQSAALAARATSCLATLTAASELLQQIDACGGLEAFWRQDSTVLAPPCPVPAADPVPVAPAPAQPRPQSAVNGTWPTALLTEADGAPLFLLFTDNAFLSVLAKNATDRRENYLRYARAGADVAWLLEQLAAHKAFDPDALFHAYEARISDDKVRDNLARGPLRRSWNVICEGMAGLGLVHDGAVVYRNASPLQQVLATRKTKLRRWTQEHD